MKKNIIALALTTLSFHTFAVVNGTEVSWQNDFDDLVKMNCTGLILGGNQILTAGHCTDMSINLSNGNVVIASKRTNHPDYRWQGAGDSGYIHDVAVWDLPESVETQNIHFLADLNNNDVVVGDNVKAYGFGGDNPLAYVEGYIDELPRLPRTWFRTKNTKGDTTQGDSGGMWTKNGKAFAVTSAGWNKSDQINSLFASKDFILDQVNGWHHQAVLKGTGSKTITVQSLHKNSVVDAAYTEGNVTITGGTCQTMATIEPFKECTYELEVNGTGKLHLSSDDVVNINPVVAPTPTPPTTPTSTGSSGGSVGFLSLFGLAILGRMRKNAK